MKTRHELSEVKKDVSRYGTPDEKSSTPEDIRMLAPLGSTFQKEDGVVTQQDRGQQRIGDVCSSQSSKPKKEDRVRAQKAGHQKKKDGARAQKASRQKEDGARAQKASHQKEDGARAQKASHGRGQSPERFRQKGRD